MSLSPEARYDLVATVVYVVATVWLLDELSDRRLSRWALARVRPWVETLEAGIELRRKVRREAPWVLWEAYETLDGEARS